MHRTTAARGARRSAGALLFGDGASYELFARIAKHATDQVKAELSGGFPAIHLPDGLSVNKHRRMTWLLYLYHLCWRFPNGGIEAEWQYAERTHAGRRPMSDGLEGYVARVAIDDFLEPGAPALGQWPQPSPYPDFDLGAFFSLVDLDDRLDGPRNKYWDDEEFTFPALFCTGLEGNIFERVRGRG